MRLFTPTGGSIVDHREKPVRFFSDLISAETTLTALMSGAQAADEAGEIERVFYLTRACLDLRQAIGSAREWGRASRTIGRAV